MTDPTLSDQDLDALLRAALRSRAEPPPGDDLARRVLHVAAAARRSRRPQTWTNWAAAAAIAAVACVGAARLAALPSIDSDATASADTESATGDTAALLLPLGGIALAVTVLGLAAESALTLPEPDRVAWAAGV